MELALSVSRADSTTSVLFPETNTDLLARQPTSCSSRYSCPRLCLKSARRFPTSAVGAQFQTFEAKPLCPPGLTANARLKAAVWDSGPSTELARSLITSIIFTKLESLQANVNSVYAILYLQKGN